MTVRVVLGEDSFLIREGLQQLLESSPTVEVVAACGDFDSLVEAIERERPDVVLTDIRMPPTKRDEGIQVAARLRESHPGTGVLYLLLRKPTQEEIRQAQHAAEGRRSDWPTGVRRRLPGE